MLKDEGFELKRPWLNKLYLVAGTAISLIWVKLLFKKLENAAQFSQQVNETCLLVWAD